MKRIFIKREQKCKEEMLRFNMIKIMLETFCAFYRNSLNRIWHYWWIINVKLDNLQSFVGLCRNYRHWIRICKWRVFWVAPGVLYLWKTVWDGWGFVCKDWWMGRLCNEFLQAVQGDQDLEFSKYEFKSHSEPNSLKFNIKSGQNSN